MLVCRVRNTLNAINLQCIGTFATLSGAGGFQDQQKDVAAVASKLFGDTVLPGNVIGDTLRRSTMDMDFSQPDALKTLKDSVSFSENKIET